MRLPETPKALMCGAALIALGACPALAGSANASSARDGPQSDFPVLVGNPYQIGGVTFVPSDSMNFDSVGYASVGTGGGRAISAAHHTLPVPSYAEVTDLRTGHTILVRIDRRGPMDGTHAIELSPGAAAQLGIATDGKAPVRVRRVNPPEAERGLLRAGEPAPERMATPKPLLDVLMRKLDPALVQRALDSNDQDAGPAAKPVTPTAAPVAKAVPIGKAKGTSPATVMPKDHVPSVPTVPAAGAVAAKPSPAGTGAYFANEEARSKTAANGGEHKMEAAKVIKPAPTIEPVRHESSERDKDKSTASFVIQAGAFSEKSRAQAVASKVGGTISPAGKMWRVRTGPYAGHASAEAALAKVKSAGYSDARILRAE